MPAACRRQESRRTGGGARPDLWLSGLRGSRVSLRVPQRGDKRALAETVTRNAAEALTQHRLKRASDLTARSAALTELADTLGMDVAPLRIECIDVSHVQGTDVVASLVVFEDGLPKRSDYRRFAIRDRPGDDVASIAEVVRRRFTGAARQDGRAMPSPRHPVGGERRRSGRRAGIAAEPQPGAARRWDARRRADLPPRHRPAHRPAAPVRLPAAVAGGRRRRTAGQCRGDALAELRHRRRHRLRPGQAAGGGLGAGPGRADHLPAHQRGPVPAAAAAGRGAPVRDHLSPGQAVEVDDRLRAGQSSPGSARSGGRR